MNPENINCEPFEILISTMLDGELPPEEQTELKVHLDQCAHCRSQANQFEHVNSAVSLLGKNLSEVSAKKPELNGVATLNASSLTDSVVTPTKPKNQPASKFSLWHLLPIATAAALVICVGVLLFQDRPVTAADPVVSPEQIAKPIVELQLINIQKERDQELMLKTLGMDLRTLKLELNQFEPGSEERKQFEEKIDAMIEKVTTFNLTDVSE